MTMTKTDTLKEHLQRAILETCELWDIWSEWWGDMAWQKKTKTMTKGMTKTIPETCDIWDTNYNFDNWEPEFMTVFVTWQLRVTLDIICNSCDVLDRTTPTLCISKDIDQLICVNSSNIYIWKYHLNSFTCSCELWMPPTLFQWHI